MQGEESRRQASARRQVERQPVEPHDLRQVSRLVKRPHMPGTYISQPALSRNAPGPDWWLDLTDGTALVEPPTGNRAGASGVRNRGDNRRDLRMTMNDPRGRGGARGGEERREGEEGGGGGGRGRGRGGKEEREGGGGRGRREGGRGEGGEGRLATRDTTTPETRGASRDRMAGRDGMAHSDRISDAGRRMDDRGPGWLLPAVVGVAVIAGIVVYAVQTTVQTRGLRPTPPPGSRPRRQLHRGRRRARKDERNPRSLLAVARYPFASQSRNTKRGEGCRARTGCARNPTQ